MVNLESVIGQMDAESRYKVLPALKVLVDEGLFTAIARVNKNQLVDQRMDSEDEAAIAKEVRDVRQTNRILLGIEESAKQLTKGVENA